MRIEKNLVALSAIALMIGIASIVPLAFLMSAKAEISPEEQPQFSVDMPYAYIANYWDNHSETNRTSLWAWGGNSTKVNMVFTIALNATPNFDPQTVAADAIFENYQIEIVSDKGPVGNVTYSVYTNCNSSEPFQAFNFYRDHWFDYNSTRDAFIMYNSINGTSIIFKTGPGLDWNRNLGEPETLAINVRRQGWIILNSNSTTAYLADPEPILQIQLEKFGNGFIYNNLIPEDELSKIDPFLPNAKADV
jgi:hypothetical protein